MCISLMWRPSCYAQRVSRIPTSAKSPRMEDQLYVYIQTITMSRIAIELFFASVTVLAGGAVFNFILGTYTYNLTPEGLGGGLLIPIRRQAGATKRPSSTAR